MVEATIELIYEVLKRVRDRLGGLERGAHDARSVIVALRGHIIAAQQDVANIYGRMASIEIRPDHNERRLDLVAEASTSGP